MANHKVLQWMPTGPDHKICQVWFMANHKSTSVDADFQIAQIAQTIKFWSDLVDGESQKYIGDLFVTVQRAAHNGFLDLCSREIKIMENH